MTETINKELIRLLITDPNSPELESRCTDLTDEQRRELKFAYQRAYLTYLYQWLRDVRSRPIHPDTKAWRELLIGHARVEARRTGRLYNLLRRAYPKYKLELKLKHARKLKITY